MLTGLRKVPVARFLAAHGAAPQRQINNWVPLWRGAMPCEALFQHPEPAFGTNLPKCLTQQYSLPLWSKPLLSSSIAKRPSQKFAR